MTVCLGGGCGEEEPEAPVPLLALCFFGGDLAGVVAAVVVVAEMVVGPVDAGGSGGAVGFREP